MKTMRQLLIKEIRVHLSGARFFWYGLTVIILVTGSFILGTLSYMEKQDNYNRLAPALDNQVFVSERRWRLTYEHMIFAEEGVDVAVKPPVLQTLVQGTEKYQNTLFNICQRPWFESKFPFIKHEKIANPAADFIPPVDFFMVCTLLLSVLVLVFSYNAVSKEREDGTLRLLLSCPVSRAHILFAKLAGGFFTAILPVFISLLVCLLITRVTPFFALSPADTAAFVVMFLYASLYLLVLYAVGVLVSTMVRKSSTAIAVLMLIWLVFIVVLHNGALIMLRNRKGGESLFTVIQRMDKNGRNSPTLFDYSWKKHDKPFVKLTGREMIDLYREITGANRKKVMPVLAKHIAEVEGDARIIRTLRFFSPSLLLESSLSEMAGTGISNYLHVMRSVYDYWDYFRKNAVEQAEIDLSFADKSRYLGRYHAYPKGKRPPLIYSEYRKFNPGSIGIAERVQATLWSAFALFCYAVFFFMLAFYAFIKAEIT